MALKEFFKRRSLRARNDVRTNAAELTVRESLLPIILVTTLFFLWGFSYSTSYLSHPLTWCHARHIYSQLVLILRRSGLLDILNKHFQNLLHINRARSAGLQAAYFGYGPQ